MTTQQSVHDQAGYIYSSVFEEIRVAQRRAVGRSGTGLGGPLIGHRRRRGAR